MEIWTSTVNDSQTYWHKITQDELTFRLNQSINLLVYSNLWNSLKMCAMSVIKKVPTHKKNQEINSLLEL